MRYLIIVMLMTLFMSLNAKDLSGKWVCSSEGASLEFITENQLNYNGELLYYEVIGSRLRIADEYLGYVDYPYKMKNSSLYITFPEGYTLMFQQKKQSKINKTKTKNSSSETYLLQGKLCSYSSSYNGGYSHSDILYFDGNGRYSTHAQSYSSGDSGSYYNDSNSADGGTYRVSGVNIYVHVNGGDSFVGNVTQRTNAGAITGIEVNGKIFARALCD